LFRIQHECPYVRFSLKHPRIRMLEWCNHKTDVLEIECPDIETFTEIESDLHDLLAWGGSKVLRKNFHGRNLQVITKTCCDNKISPSVTGMVEGNSFMEIPPIVYFGGWEEHRVMGFRESDYRKMFRDLKCLGPVEIMHKKLVPEKSIRDTFVISLASVFSELTDKQAEALVTALDHGYYQVPKKTTAEEISRKSGVPRTTYEEHVRKAESKIFRSMAPYIRMYASRTPVHSTQESTKQLATVPR
jgi:predicted DNA binding protein